MSTLAIPPQRVKLYRALWDRWIIVLRILFDLGAGAHPVKWRAVADTLLVDKKTCQKYINGLVRDGHIATAGEGYMLTSAGMSALLENEHGEFLPLEGKIPGENFSPLVVVVNDLTSEDSRLTTTTESGKNPGEKFSPLAMSIVDHIPDLFAGSQLVLNGLMPLASDEVLLGWVAYAYDKRTSLSSPVGLIYSKLRRDERPPIEFMKNYVEYLPESFLEAVGQLRKTCSLCEQVFQGLAEFKSHMEQCHPEPADVAAVEPGRTIKPDETVTERINGCMSAEQAWQAVQGQLQMEMPRASFDTWVRATQAVRFDRNVLSVGVINAYARDWLESRLQSTVERLLVGILNQSVVVEFVAVETIGVE